VQPNEDISTAQQITLESLIWGNVRLTTTDKQRIKHIMAQFILSFIKKMYVNCLWNRLKLTVQIYV